MAGCGPAGEVRKEPGNLSREILVEGTNLSRTGTLRHNGRMSRLESMVLAASVCLLAAAGWTRASPVEQGAAGHIEQATSAFSALDFEGALEHAEQALRCAGNTTGDLVRIHALRALCLISIGRQEEAERAFTAVLSLDPAFRLGPDVSPRYSQPFSRLLDRGVPPLEVDVAPPGEATAGRPLRVRVRLVHDPARLADHLLLHLRRGGEDARRTLRLDLVRGKRLRFELPADLVEQPGLLAWYAEVRDRHGGLLAMKGDAEHPLRLQLRPEPKPVASAAAVPPAVATAPGPKDPSPHQAEGDADAGAWYERWWVWALIGGAAVAVAAGTTAGVLAADDGASRRDFSLVIE